MFLSPTRWIALAALPLTLTTSVEARSDDAQKALASPIPGECRYENDAADSSVVTGWNAVILTAICVNEPWPTTVSRSMFLVHAAIYDAWAVQDPVAATYAYQRSIKPVAHVPPMIEADLAEAVSVAAHAALVHEFLDNRALFDARLDSLGYDLPVKGLDPGSPAAIGLRAAREVMDLRLRDGSNSSDDYASPGPHRPVNAADLPIDGVDPNRWQPLLVPTGTVTEEVEIDGYRVERMAMDPDDPASFVAQCFLTPHWGDVTPFALASGAALRPAPPAQHGTARAYTDATGRVSTGHLAWVDQVAEVAKIQAELTDQQKVMAEDWADGPRSTTPPGHWNLFAEMVSLRDGHDVAADAKLFFALNAALMDAAIATWDAKLAYDYIRPATAIRYHYRGQDITGWRGPGMGIGRISAEEWQPYQDLTFVTPAFAEYRSRHSTFSAAGAKILRRFTGSTRFYDADTQDGDFEGDGQSEAIGTHVVRPGDGAFEPGMPRARVTLRAGTPSRRLPRRLAGRGSMAASTCRTVTCAADRSAGGSERSPIARWRSYGRERSTDDAAIS